MHLSGSAKLVLVGLGAIVLFAQFGPLGVVLLGIGLMLIDN